ncbi:uncharacterized protein LOC131649087 [Vicia villosa]|uniref:uncharacterized protein LOC131649087 n=1 Tax=Vicia villosa TaxID=3911 RepID=UPI00273B5491|nr:uncharacterized protein LOC131649087 [Vicia villosa]
MVFQKKRKIVGDESDRLHKKRSSGINISEPGSVPVLPSKFVSTEVPPVSQPEIQPQKALAKSPPTTKVLTPPPSPKTKGTAPFLVFDHPVSEPILEVLPLNTLFPPYTTISISQPPPHSNPPIVDNPVVCNTAASESFDSDSFNNLLRDWHSYEEFRSRSAGVRSKSYWCLHEEDEA